MSKEAVAFERLDKYFDGSHCHNQAWQTLKPFVHAQLSHNTGSPKLPSETDFMLWVHSHKETPSPCEVYDYLNGQLRASA